MRPKEHTAIKARFVNAISPLHGQAEAEAMFRLLSQDFPNAKRLDAARLDATVSRILPELLSGRPLQYILGEAWFYGLPLFVDESVLIPRPETEELVDQIVKVHRHVDSLQIIDIGTGSGCIALALKHALPQAEVWAVDVSSDALKVAKNNASNHGLDVRFMQADILEWDVIFDAEIRFDVIVSNPPYITPDERSEMAPHVLRFEPELALFAPEDAPLLFYQHIADFAQHHLTASGRLYFEINQAHGREVVDLLRKKGFGSIELVKDMQGADRIVAAHRSNEVGRK